MRQHTLGALPSLREEPPKQQSSLLWQLTPKRLELVWNPDSVLVDGSTIRCQIGGDVVVIRIFNQANTDKIEVKASRDEVTVESVLEVVRGRLMLRPLR